MPRPVTSHSSSPAKISLCLLILHILSLSSSPLAAFSLFANDKASADKEKIEEPAPNPYAYLNWVRRSEFSQYDGYPGLDEVPDFCGGTYLPSMDTLNDTHTAQSSVVKAYANKAQHWPGDNSTLTGNVEVQQGGLKFEADEVFFDYKTGLAQAPKKLKMNVDGMLLLGENAKIDLLNQSLELANIEYVIYKAHIWGAADSISKDKTIASLTKATYTTCEPDDRPSWRLRAGKIHLNSESGWGSASNVWLDLFNIPLLYVPYFRFPIDDQRHTGLLFPSIASGENGGIDFTQPFYINLAPNYDLTLSPRRIANRGLLWQSEFRYLGETQQGRLEIANLDNDKKIADAEKASSSSTATDVTPERNFAAWQHQGSYGKRWRSKISMEYASDEDYFQDFGDNLDVSNTTHLLRMLNLSYGQQHWAFSGTFQGYQTLDEDIADQDLPYSQLPRLQLNGLVPINNRLNYLLNTEYVYFDRNIDDAVSSNTTGHRAQIETGVQLNYEPLWGFVVPTVKVRHIGYALEEQNSNEKSSPEATLPIVTLDSGLFFERKFKWGDRPYLQTLDPRLFYLYTPFEDQNSQPNFDTTALTDSYYQLFRERRFTGGDRIGDNNQLTLGLNSSIMGATDGRERAYFRLGQGFFLDKRRLQLDTLPPDDAEQSPISGEIGVTFSRDWILHSTFTWDSAHNINEENTISITYKPGNGRLASAEFRSRETVIDNDFDNRERRSQSKFSFALPLHNQWTTLGYWYFNLKDQDNLPGSTTLESFIGFEYENCCIKARLLNHRYLREQENQLEPKQQLLLQLQLKGLANFDDNVAKLIAIGIPFYEQRFKQN